MNDPKITAKPEQPVALCSSDLLERIRSTMQLCENFPCGGIGPDGPMQGDLDDAIEAGHPIGNDDTYHRGQQIWINLNELAGMVTLMRSNAELSDSRPKQPTT